MQSVQPYLKAKNQVGKQYSHLYFQEKYLKTVPKVNPSKESSVIYLFNNHITKIENLDGFPNMTCLYLQNNDIKRIENLEALKKLKKLYLSHNHISTLEGLQTNGNLVELHMEKQSLPNGTPLCFDPRSVMALSHSLRILNISNNNISSIISLTPLINLRFLDASNNDLDDINDVCQTLSHWYHLRDAYFFGNAFTKQHRYREKIISSSISLKTLDGKEISDVMRVFVKRFYMAKMVRSKESVV
ncbi:unnamed protein product [Phaedon cochleariae]|uniref:Uncharacterized protein n=1 Tax=Phaedon cochleariae TaxID=80249 RepID=A0A9P0DPS2_PHACE|nr:unnamed protein product [Phaedon cochleariae]